MAMICVTCPHCQQHQDASKNDKAFSDKSVNLFNLAGSADFCDSSLTCSSDCQQAIHFETTDTPSSFRFRHSKISSYSSGIAVSGALNSSSCIVFDDSALIAQTGSKGIGVSFSDNQNLWFKNTTLLHYGTGIVFQPQNTVTVSQSYDNYIDSDTFSQGTPDKGRFTFLGSDGKNHVVSNQGTMVEKHESASFNTSPKTLVWALAFWTVWSQK